jgi:chemotaxis-related protein WspB
MLLFFVGDDAYAVDCQYIQEVIPKIELKKIPHAPRAVAGLITISGQPVTVIDFSQLIAERPSADYLHTRIILFSLEIPSGGTRVFGLIAEKVIEIIDRDPTEFVETGLRIKDLPYLDGVCIEKSGSIQLFNAVEFFQAMQSILNMPLIEKRL